MDKHQPEKPFERCADDVVVPCKKERQAQYVLRSIGTRMRECGLKLHPTKNRIVNLRGKSEIRYARKYGFLGMITNFGRAACAMYGIS